MTLQSVGIERRHRPGRRHRERLQAAWQEDMNLAIAEAGFDFYPAAVFDHDSRRSGQAHSDLFAGIFCAGAAF